MRHVLVVLVDLRLGLVLGVQFCVHFGVASFLESLLVLVVELHLSLDSGQVLPLLSHFLLSLLLGRVVLVGELVPVGARHAVFV